MSDTKIKANLYIDGNFTVHIHKYLAKKFGKTIDWSCLLEYVKDKIAKEESVTCLLESQFFVGTGKTTTDPERDYLFNAMEHARITKHATPLKSRASGGLKEDAVDTNLVFFATQDYYKREKYDYLVLLAGDSDFVPLVRGLEDEGVKTFLLYMDFSDPELGITQTAQALLDSTSLRADIESLRRERVEEKIKSIFVDYQHHDKDPAPPPPAKAHQPSRQSEERPKSARNSAGAKKPPFTKEQLVDAIKEKQRLSCDGKNEYVLLAQVGFMLKSMTNISLHGKILTTIKKAFPNEFDIDESEFGAAKIRLK
ncbi:MAG: NYN domain-containing protein [Treponema sp.]|nr:NYN domain-containing protein [Treponema sp.]